MPATTSSSSGRRSVSETSTIEDSESAVDPVDLQRATSGPSARAKSRQASLANSLTQLRRRTKLVATDRWLLIAGSVMVPLGAILVMLGWFGASHTGRLFEQIPYMISGGLFGLVLVIAGGFCYFGFWLTRLVSDERHQSHQLLEALGRIEAQLAKGSNGSNGRSSAETPAGRPEFVATVKGTLYHRPDCQVVADRNPQDLRAVRAGARGRTPCRICLPPQEEEGGEEAASQEADPSPAD